MNNTIKNIQRQLYYSAGGGHHIIGPVPNPYLDAKTNSIGDPTAADTGNNNNLNLKLKDNPNSLSDTQPTNGNTKNINNGGDNNNNGGGIDHNTSQNLQPQHDEVIHAIHMISIPTIAVVVAAAAAMTIMIAKIIKLSLN
jgi:hypothetical protein